VLLPDWVLSKGHALDILVSDPSIKTQIVTNFRPAPMVELLVSGTYRLQCWDEGADSISHETVFFVPTGWLPGLRIALEPPRQECLQRTKPVERGERSFPTGERIHVPKFRILEHLVTNAEFDRFRDATHSNAERPGSDVRPAPDASAWVTFTSALAYAQWAGGRLPLWPELALAREHGQISRAADAAITGEFVLDIGPDGGLLQVSFDAEENPHFSFAQRDNLMRETGRCPGFRLVFAADSPAYYREVAAQPIQR
jgi:hypothetical protein